MLRAGYYTKIALLEMRGKKINKTKEIVKHYLKMIIFTMIVILTLITIL